MVIHEEKDPDVWKAPQVDHNQLQEAKKYATPERKVIDCGRCALTFQRGWGHLLRNGIHRQSLAFKFKCLSSHRSYKIFRVSIKNCLEHYLVLQNKN